jgi:hypothetical protein
MTSEVPKGNATTTTTGSSTTASDQYWPSRRVTSASERWGSRSHKHSRHNESYRKNQKYPAHYLFHLLPSLFAERQLLQVQRNRAAHPLVPTDSECVIGGGVALTAPALAATAGPLRFQEGAVLHKR